MDGSYEPRDTGDESDILATHVCGGPVVIKCGEGYYCPSCGEDVSRCEDCGEWKRATNRLGTCTCETPGPEVRCRIL